MWALWLAALSSLRATGKKVRMCRMGENLGAGWARLGLGSRDDWAPGRKGCRPATGRREEGAGAQGWLGKRRGGRSLRRADLGSRLRPKLFQCLRMNRKSRRVLLLSYVSEVCCTYILKCFCSFYKI